MEKFLCFSDLWLFPSKKEIRSIWQDDYKDKVKQYEQMSQGGLWPRDRWMDLFLLHSADMVCFVFWQIEGWWQPNIKLVYPQHFSSGACSLHVFLCHFHVIGSIWNVSNSFDYYLYYSDLWSVISDAIICSKITDHWRLRWWLAFFSSKAFSN